MHWTYDQNGLPGHPGLWEFLVCGGPSLIRGECISPLMSGAASPLSALGSQSRLWGIPPLLSQELRISWAFPGPSAWL